MEVSSKSYPCAMFGCDYGIMIKISIKIHQIFRFIIHYSNFVKDLFLSFIYFSFTKRFKKWVCLNFNWMFYGRDIYILNQQVIPYHTPNIEYLYLN